MKFNVDLSVFQKNEIVGIRSIQKKQLIPHKENLLRDLAMNEDAKDEEEKNYDEEKLEF